MFEKFKQLKQLKELQDSVSKEKVEVERNGVKIIMNGKLEVEEIKIDPAIDRDKQEKIIKECLNEAIKKIQLAISKKMAGMSGLGF